MCTDVCAGRAGNKTYRRHKQREDKAAAAAALLQAAVEDEQFGHSIRDLETSFGHKFQEFIAGDSASGYHERFPTAVSRQYGNTMSQLLLTSVCPSVCLCQIIYFRTDAMSLHRSALNVLQLLRPHLCTCQSDLSLPTWWGWYAELQEMHQSAQGDAKESRDELESLSNLIGRLDFNDYFKPKPDYRAMLANGSI